MMHLCITQCTYWTPLIILCKRINFDWYVPVFVIKLRIVTLLYVRKLGFLVLEEYRLQQHL